LVAGVDVLNLANREMEPTAHSESPNRCWTLPLLRLRPPCDA
jgi:hypothetical protein